jgi:hypothetical protein
MATVNNNFPISVEATTSEAGSQTRFHRSWNLRSASLDAHSCSLRWTWSTRSFASSRLRLGSGTTSSGSTSIRVPRPVQSGHAPYGELNENDRGSSSSNDKSS